MSPETLFETAVKFTALQKSNKVITIKFDFWFGIYCNTMLMNVTSSIQSLFYLQRHLNSVWSVLVVLHGVQSLRRTPVHYTDVTVYVLHIYVDRYINGHIKAPFYGRFTFDFL